MGGIKFVKNILNKIASQEEKKILGRWNIDYCNQKLNKKVDLSNEDHCGPCGQYILDKNANTNANANTNTNTKTTTQY